MKRKNFKRIAAATLALMMIAPSASNLAAVQAQEVQVRTQSQTQMSSEKEVVYVNTYSDATAREQNFDANWKFYLGSASGAESTTFDDSKWENISLPHDYSIEQEYSKSMEAESGYLPGGTGWYRKHFVVSEELRGKELRIDFGGVYMNATVWVNGEQLGTHPYGYTPFSFDITDYVQFGEENVITVKVDHQTPSSRWYSGSGIYRSVNLTVTNPVHVDLYGTKIETPNLETEKGGTVNMTVKATVANASEEAKNVVLTHTIYEKGTTDSIGTVTTTAQSVAAGQKADITATLPATNPSLWDTKNPNLYTVTTEVKVGDTVVDTYDTEYGFRYITLNTETGFYLNGEKLKLKGVCMHHDQGSLGSEAHYRAIERQVEILQAMGCNSIRVTHNPAADELIEICNKKGILVIDELFDGWMYAKNGNSNDYAKWFSKNIESGNEIIGAEDGMTWAKFDLTATIKRGQNSPSVIMYSLGNEIQEGAGGSGYAAMADNLIAWARAIDTTKPLTIGSNAVKNGGGEHIQIGNKLTAVGGMSGTNYSGGASYDSLHRAYPDWFLYGSETASSVNSRGVYYKTNGSNSNQDLTSYDESKVGWGALASEAWYDVITRDFVAGEYVWTGFDYIGEPTPWNGTSSGGQGTWPSPKNSFFGIIDTAGIPKDSYYLYQSQWNDDVNTLHILPAWNENVVAKDASGKVPVVVYSDAASVELFFKEAGSDTATSLGKKTFTEKTTGAGYTYQIYEGEGKDGTTHKNLYLKWQVPYADGEVYAVAYDKSGDVISNTEGRSSVKTTGVEAQLEAVVDRTEITADGRDLAYIQVDVTDADGNIVPDADDRVTFKVEGEGVLVGVDNGNQTDHDSYQANNRKAYNGSLIAIVQSTKNAGTIQVTATADGLASDTVTVKTTAVESEETVKQVDSFFMSKNYYVKVGTRPTLPTEVETRYTDGTEASQAVVWDTIEASDVEAVGSFTVTGKVSDLYTVSVIVNVIDEVGGLLNYSTTVSKGEKPILPDARPAVMVDGTILAASFPVEWDAVADKAYDTVGSVTVNGTADVLGTELPVTATVRVQEETITIGDSVSGAGKLSQNIEGSDTLEAIKDGSTTISDNNAGGANPTAWSNWSASQKGNNKAEITFEYDTQQRIGQIVIHFACDSGSMRYPDAGTTEIYVSETGAADSWTKVNATETIGSENGRVKPYTYDFTPFTATFVKFCLTNADVQTGSQWKPCTAITEVELKKAQGTFVVNTTAKLASLTVNEAEVTEAQLALGIYYTLDETANVTAVGKDNAAVTVLPVHNHEILIIVESEDHNTRSTFTIKLGQEAPLDPADASKDYPVSKLTATAGSAQTGYASEGPANLALDGNPSTHYHSSWNPKATNDQLWVTLELEEATRLTALRYLPRSGPNNGTVTKYEISYSMDGADWKKIASGDWAVDKDWKLAQFDSVVEAKYVKLFAVDSVGDNGGRHMSAAELRLVVAGSTSTPDPDPQPPVDTPDADDDSRDIPVSVLTATAGSAQTLSGNNTTEGPANLALDGNTGTLWHSLWAGDNRENLWIQFELSEDYQVDGLRYLPRANAGGRDAFGTITSYKIQVSNDGTDWTDATTGDWANDNTWKIATFDATNAKYVRLVAVASVSDARQFASAAEIRLTGVEDAIPECQHTNTELQGKVEATCTTKGYTGDTVCTDCNETITIGREVAATGHAYGEWTVTIAATCTEKGVETRVCANDASHTETREIAAEGHKYGDWVVIKDATTEEEGLKEKTCSVCKDKISEVIPKLPVVPEDSKDKEVVQKYYEECLKYYTEETFGATASWSKYLKAMEDLKTILADKEATTAEIAEAMKAVEALAKDIVDEKKEIEKEPVKPGEPDKKPNGSEDKNDSPTTGDNAMVFPIILMAAYAVMCVVVLLKKRVNR